MKAILHRPPRGFSMIELPIPAPRPEEVCIAVLAVGFNPIDVQMARGEERAHPSGVFGREVAGVVHAVGGAVEEFQVGEAVFAYLGMVAGTGAYAEFVCLPAAMVARKPQCLDFTATSTIPVAGMTALRALGNRVTGLREQALLVTGAAGGVGTFVVALAAAKGFRKIVGTAGSDESEQLARQMGATAVLRYDRFPRDELAFVFRELIGADGAPLVIDTVGKAMLRFGFEVLAVNGSVVAVASGPTAEEVEMLYSKSARLHLLLLGAAARHGVNLHDYGKDLTRLAQYFDRGLVKLPPTEVVGSFSVATVVEAHRRFTASQVRGKLAMTLC